VVAGVCAGADAAIVRFDQLFADHRARGLACIGGLRERDPRPDQQRFDRADRGPERARDLGVRHAGQLPHQQRRALLIGQPANVLYQSPQRLAEVELDQRIVHRGAAQLENLRRRRSRLTQLIDAAVVGDPEQPGSQGETSVGCPESRVGAYENVLERVFGILATGQHLPGIGEQTPVVAIVDRPERLLVPGPEQRHELVVGTEAQQRGSDRGPGLGQCCCWWM
jgi:hypothetical protein